MTVASIFAKEQLTTFAGCAKLVQPAQPKEEPDVKFEISKLMKNGRKVGKVFSIRRNFPSPEHALHFMMSTNSDATSDHQVLNVQLVQKPTKLRRKSI